MLKSIVILSFTLLVFNVPIHASSTFQECIDEHVKIYKKPVSQLLSLTCSNMKITSLDGIDQLSNLEKLDVRNNAITEIPNSIGSLKKLKEINISNNQLTTLPAALWKLPELTVFSAVNNSLTDLNIVGITKTKIEKLDFSGNALQKISEGISSIVTIQELNFSYNFVETLPSFEKLVDLRVLKIQFNNLMVLPNLKNNPLEVLLMEKNLLPEETITTAKGLFIPANQNQIRFYDERVKITVFGNWMATSKILPALLVLNDGRQVESLHSYQLVAIVDEFGMSRPLGYYLDTTGKVTREGVIRAYIQVIDSDGNTSENGRSASPVTIEFIKSTSKVDPEKSTSNNEDDSTTNNEDTQNVIEEPNVSEGGLPNIQPDPPLAIQQSIEEKVLADSWMFSIGLDGKAGEKLSLFDQFLGFFRINIFVTVTTIVSILLIPLFLLLVIIYFNRKMFEKNENILKRRMKK